VELDAPDGRLRLAVRDDGRGSRGWRPGVGMSSMRERVEQVGGTLVAAPGRDGGVVEAEIPLGPTGPSGQPPSK
jgi:two-component system NarL family sensor kinase